MAEALLASTMSRRFVNNILQSMGDALIVLDPSSVIRLVNHRTEELTGYSAAELVGRPFGGLLEDGADAWMSIAAALARGSLTGQEHQLRTRKAGLLTISLTASLLRGERMSENGTVLVAKDISERKQLEAELARTRDAALESAKLKSQFVANMSHEIRTPLNGILGMTGLLRDTELDERQAQYLDTVQTSADALLSLISDILDFSKIEAGKLDFESIPFALDAVAEDVLDLLKVRVKGKPVELVLRVEDGVDPRVIGDPGRVRQVLTNLVGNAVKFTTKGDVIVTLRAEPGAAALGRTRLRLEVRDTGSGVPQGSQDRLFEPFTQVDGSSTRAHGGTGLGLAISRQLVGLMGGIIGMTSEVGKGSTFWFSMELDADHDAQSDPDVPQSLQGARVIVADDNAACREAIALMLRRWGAEIEEVGSLDALVRRLDRSDAGCELLILEHDLDGADGAALAARLRKAHPDHGYAQLLLTELGVNVPRRALAEAQVGRCVQKPVRSRTLLRALGAVLAGEMPAGPLVSRGSPQRSGGLFGDRKVRVLVADDNPINQRVAVAQLATLGLTADVASNGQEVLLALQYVEYDVILMDCQMPEMDGYDATRTIRRNRGSGPPFIVAMTAHAMQGERERCIEAGMNEYLAKPFRAQQLASVLTSLLTPSAAALDRTR
jgi:two-component system, sensor histidine kinase and response regulator